jgi:hypothetical protein
MKTTLLLFLSFSLSIYAQTHTISGKIYDVSGRGIAYANVFVLGSSIGTTANEDGAYVLKLKPGEQTVVYKQIGYTTVSKQLNINRDISLDVSLLESVVALKEVVVNTEQNPAIRIIKKAQSKRAFYRDQVKAFTCDVYIKGIQKIKEAPKKVMGVKISIPTLVDSNSGIIYLSESVSKFQFEQDNKIKEDMIASKVSGSNNAFSFNRASDMYFNFYESLMKVDQLVPRGIISPIAANAFLTYKYDYKGVIIDQNIVVHKIAIKPKVKTDPAFTGNIYVQDSTWRLHAADVYITKSAGIAFVDTLKIKQNYIEINPSTWLPFNNLFTFSFGFFGIKGSGQYTSTNSNYQIFDDIPDSSFSSLQFKVSKASLNRDTAFWNTFRPVPLSTEEKKDYQLKDSVMRIRRSKPYLDSVDKKSNRFELINLIAGYKHVNSFKKKSWGINSLFDALSYNTVQGWNVDLNLNFDSRDSLRRFKNIKLLGQYGFANKRFGGGASYYYYFNTRKLSSIYIKGGRFFEQYNEERPIGQLNNLIYTLLLKQNEMKLYQNTGLSATYRTEAINSLYYELSMGVQQRQFVENSSLNFIKNNFFKQNENNFSNNLLDFDNANPYLYQDNSILQPRVTLEWKAGQKYELRENRKIIVEQRWPSFKGTISAGIPLSGKNGTSFLKAELKVKDNIDLNLIGKTEWQITYAQFITQKNLRAPDYIHINGNQTLFTDFNLNQFQLAPYYTYSTNQYLFTGAVQQNFGGFIVNKIPLLNHLHLEEHAGIRAFHSDKQKLYTEYSFGLSKLFFRAEYVFGYDLSAKKTLNGLRIGILL